MGKKILWMILIMSIWILAVACQQPNEENKPSEPPSATPQAEEPEKRYEQKQDQQSEETKSKQPIIREVPDFTYTKMEQMIQELTERYSQIRIGTSGKSAAGRKLYLLKLGKGPKKLNVVAGVHGREGITSLLTLKLLEDYARALEKGQDVVGYDVQEVLSQVELSVIPMLNPDGVEIAVAGPPKNKRDFYLRANEGSDDFERWKANGRGVDLNNQFRADWQSVESVGEPHFEKYKGSKPESEPESRWLADLARQEQFDMVVAYHNSGSIIFWYYNQEGQAYQRDYRLAQAIRAKNGYQLIEPDESDTQSAGYKDWFVKEFQRPGFTIEVGDGKAEEPLPSSQLDRYFAENRGVLLELGQRLGK